MRSARRCAARADVHIGLALCLVGTVRNADEHLRLPPVVARLLPVGLGASCAVRFVERPMASRSGEHCGEWVADVQKYQRRGRRARARGIVQDGVGGVAGQLDVRCRCGHCQMSSALPGLMWVGSRLPSGLDPFQ
ncbi:hypothetical protein CC78DRAFT_575496 [Lojkania enalia]|uniref:Uncharacterized protein n=1 Tax=Lojkania enalia TaxID=147567 RepID=A0A9P4KIE0_9PLEO|nr:hypothetical protein CC78DRAFT_575496 [Didymosphaeria enalia]